MANEFKVKKGLIVFGSGSTVLDVQGSQGQLFSITDSLSGSLFKVSDISGIPILEVFSDDTVKIGTFNNEAIVVSGTTANITGSFTGSFNAQGSGQNLLLDDGTTVATSSIQTSLPDGTVSGSSQINYPDISNIPSGIVSGSSQNLQVILILVTLIRVEME
jgi:hypothetical protein